MSSERNDGGERGAVSSRKSSVDRQSRERLYAIWRSIEAGDTEPHTSVVVPSLSFDTEELAKITGASLYEERLLFTLMRLRHPAARVLYVTSQPIHPEILEYYLGLLASGSGRPVRDRFRHLCLFDSSTRPLTAKILERPRVLERLRDWIGEPERAYLTCFNSTKLERELSNRLGIPLNGVDPDLLWLGSKSGSRKVFSEAGVTYPAGAEDLRTEDEIVRALSELERKQPGLRRAVIKLNESFAGAGNAIFTYPDQLPEAETIRRELLRSALQGLRWSESGGGFVAYMAKMVEMGGIVEEMVEADEVHSPSVQMRIEPNGQLALVSSHDQILEGATGQSYVGCRFPADEAYRDLIQMAALAVGEVLQRHGVISRFGVDFVATRSAGEPWKVHAIEINLRMGGTTTPFLALQFLTGGELDGATGQLRSSRGEAKYYRATDSLRSPSYRGLLPEDLFEIMAKHHLGFDKGTDTGVVFHMIGALSQYGKVGATCVGNSREEAEEVYRQVVEILDRETSTELRSADTLTVGERRLASME